MTSKALSEFPRVARTNFNDVFPVLRSGGVNWSDVRVDGGDLLAEMLRMRTPVGAISFLDKPGKHPAFSHSRNTVGALCQQFDGSFYQPGVGEIGSHGMRRIKEWASWNTSSWYAVGCVLSGDASSAAGATLTENSGSGEHRFYQNNSFQTVLAVQAGEKWFGGFEIKAGTRRYVQISLGSMGTGPGAIILDTQSMTVVHSSTAGGSVVNSSSVAEKGDGWYSVWLAVTFGVATSAYLGLQGSDAATVSFPATSSGSGTVQFRYPKLRQARPGQAVMDPENVSLGVVTEDMLGPEMVALEDFDKRAATDGTVTFPGGVLNFVSAASGLSTSVSVPLSALAGQRFRMRATLRYVSGNPSGVRLQFRNSDGGGGSDLASAAFVTSTTFVESTLDYTAASTATIHPTFNSASSTSNEFEVQSVSVRRINYHGWGVDGVQCFATDEYGNDLRIGLGPELVTNGSDGFTDATGWTAYSGSSQSVVGGVLTNTASDGTSDHSGYTLTGLKVGSLYEIAVRLSGSGSSSRIASWAPFSITPVSATGVITETVFQATATATSGDCRFYSSASGGSPGDTINVHRFSVREVYPVRAAGAVRNPAITTRVRNSGDWDAAGWNLNASGAMTLGSDGPFGVSERMTTSAGFHGRYHTMETNAAAAGEVYCASVYLKYVSGAQEAKFGLGGTAFAAESEYRVNLSTGTQTLAATNGGTGAFTPVPGWPGWYRLNIVRTTASAGTVIVTVYTVGSGGVFDCDELNCTLSGAVLPPVPTTSAAVALAADADPINAEAVWWDSANGGVIAITASLLAAYDARGTNRLIEAYSDASNRVVISRDATNLRLLVTLGGVQMKDTLSPLPFSVGDEFGLVVRIEDGDIKVWVNGALIDSTTASDVPPISLICFACDGSFASYTTAAKREAFIFPPGTLTDAQCLALSTGDLPVIAELA